MRKYVICIFAGLLCLPAAWAQTSSSTVRGTITDQHQAVIPRAAVTLTNTATNVARSALTNESGVYVFPGVFPGPYRVSAELPGMQKFEGTLIVQAQQDATVDVTLQVGQTVTQVDVQDVTPM